MEQSNGNADVCLLVKSRFEEHEVSAIQVDGRPVWPARQMGLALGYHGDGQRLVGRITNEWAEELTEGIDYLIFSGDQLAAVKAAAPDLVDSRAPSLMLLTESGVHLVALLSRQPAAKRLRRWLAEEVLPQLRRTGTYTLAEPPTPERPKLLTRGGKLSARDVRRLNLPDAAEQLASTVYPTFGEPNPALTEAALRKPHALTDLMTGLVLRLVRHEAISHAELLVAELAKTLGRPLPEVVDGAPAKEIPFARARVLLDGVPEHLLLHGLVTLNAIHAALKGPWVGKHEETVRIANEMFELHQRIAYNMHLWQKELDYTVSDLTDAMKAHPNHARLLAMVVRDITDRTPERWMELFLHEQRRPSPRRLTMKKEVA